MRAVLLAAGLVALPAAALAQDDGVVSTAPAPGAATAAPGGSTDVLQLPKMRQISPVRDNFDRNDGKPHGSVSATIGTGGVRAYSGHVTVKPSDNVSIGVAGAYYQGPFYYPGYGPDYGYQFQPRTGGYLGETVETLQPTDEPAPPPPG